jgi:hypothetical protein
LRGDVAFVRASEPEQMQHLVAVLNIVVAKAIGRRVEVENGFISYLREHRFVPGNAQADGTLKPEETQIRDAPYL